MNLEFENLVVENVRAFIGKHKFALSDGEAGLFFLRGKNKLEPRLESNDAGKSTLFDSFSWCLYGRTTKGLQAPDLKTFSEWGLPADTRMSVTVGFCVDEKEYDITRTANPNSLKLNGKTCGQADIERLLQMSHELFLNTVLLAQGRPLFFDLSPKNKLELFSEALNLVRWDSRSDFARDKVKALEQKLSKYEGELEGLQAAAAETSRNMTKAKTESDEWASAQEQKIDGLRDNLSDMRKALNDNTKRKGDASLAYDGAGAEVKALQSESQQLSDQWEVARDKYNKAAVKIEALKSDKRRLVSELQSLGATDKCPTCGQKVTGTNFDRHKQELKKQILDNEVGIERGIPKSIEKEMTTFKKAIEQSRLREKEFQDKADVALSSLQRLNGVVARAEGDVKNLQDKIAEEEKAENAYYRQYISLKKSHAKMKAQLTECEDDIAWTRTLVERTKPWVKGFKDIRLYIVDECLRELEFVTNAMLGDVGLEGWSVHYDIEKETKSGTIQRGLNVVVRSPKNKQPVKWEVWGGGVGQRLRIVGSLALSEVLLAHAGVTPNLEVLDEPARHMTKAGVRDLYDYLATRAVNTKKTVWFIDHMSVENDKFDAICTVVKDDGGSHLVWS